MLVWLIYVGCSVAAIALCRLEWAFARSVCRAALASGATGTKRLLAKSLEDEAFWRVVLASMSLAIAALATANRAAYGPPTLQVNGFQVGIRALLIGIPCVLFLKSYRTRHVRLAFADAALHSDEFDEEMREPYMTALWESTAMLVVDADSGIIVRSSTRADELFMYPAGYLIGMNVDRLVPVNVRESHAASRRAYAADPSTRYSHGTRFKGLRRDGTEIPLAIQLVPVLNNSRILVLVSDTTPMEV